MPLSLLRRLGRPHRGLLGAPVAASLAPRHGVGATRAAAAAATAGRWEARRAQQAQRRIDVMRGLLASEGDAMWFKVRGVSYRQDVIGKLRSGDAVWAEPEDDNKHDPSAVAVRCEHGHIGYVPRDATAAVRKALQRAPADGGRGVAEEVLEWSGPTGVVVRIGQPPAEAEAAPSSPTLPRLSGMRKAELEAECRERGLSASGTVAQLRDALRTARSRAGV
eukprot:TRINITY_DN53968_c0_g1_i2.p2 TRINITY_DN53968_c0_g1~~TRINITY_DN53968_c0_g1_i2.p2  ORF type:complete len:244 (+),score=44.07 TRINITY_DN53968_c0_g1_i2:71-733(+)